MHKERPRVQVQRSCSDGWGRQRRTRSGSSAHGPTAAIEANGTRIDGLSVRVDELTGRVGALEEVVSTRFADHEVRIRALEQG